MTRTFVLLLFVSSPALAQPTPPSSLEVAIAARHPRHELVPRSCTRGDGDVAVRDGRICLFDGTTNVVRAVRRVGLGGEVAAARQGAEVFFASFDEGGSARSRFDGRVWRWDLRGDRYLGVARADRELYGSVVRRTSFGVLYAAGAGLHLHDGTRAQRVSAPWRAEELLYDTHLWVHDGATYAHRRDEGAITRVSLDGARLTQTPVARIVGEPLLTSERWIVSVRQARARRFVLHVSDVSTGTTTSLELPAGMRRPRSARMLRDGRVYLAIRGGGHAALTLDATPSVSVLTAKPPELEETERAETELVVASSLRELAGLRDGGLYVGSSSARFVLDARGVQLARGTRTPPWSSCQCVERAMVCRDGTRVDGACPDVEELEVIDGDFGRVRSTLFSPDGRFRIDRIEADHGRITRLSDGARLWVRVFGDVLLVQSDDGHYFLSDRSLEDRFAVREGADLLGAPLVPLATRAGTHFDPELVARFFGAR